MESLFLYPGQLWFLLVQTDLLKMFTSILNSRDSCMHRLVCWRSFTKCPKRSWLLRADTSVIWRSLPLQWTLTDVVVSSCADTSADGGLITSVQNSSSFFQAETYFLKVVYPVSWTAVVPACADTYYLEVVISVLNINKCCDSWTLINVVISSCTCVFMHRRIRWRSLKYICQELS